MGLTNILKTLRDHMGSGLPHGATSAKTAGTVMARDSAGRSKVAEPSAADDIATKGYADGVKAYADNIVKAEADARGTADTNLAKDINTLNSKLAAETSAREATDSFLLDAVNASGGSLRIAHTTCVQHSKSVWALDPGSSPPVHAKTGVVLTFRYARDTSSGDGEDNSYAYLASGSCSYRDGSVGYRWYLDGEFPTGGVMCLYTA